MNIRLLLNLPARIRFAVKHPAYASNALLRALTLADERLVARITDAKPLQVRSFMREPFRDKSITKCFGQFSQLLDKLECPGASPYSKHVLLQYAVVRALRPNLVVETGVANGVSSTYLLQALRKNGHGTLHSIDIGDAEYLPPGNATGWIVPDHLREDWSLHLGDSRQLLPKLLSQLGEIDLFIHDSLHTYEMMTFEYQTAYPHLREGAVMISDDATWNAAFDDFVRLVVPREAGVARGLGLMKK